MEGLKACVGNVDKAQLDKYTVNALNGLQHHWNNPNGTYPYHGWGFCYGDCEWAYWLFWIFMIGIILFCCIGGIIFVVGAWWYPSYGGRHVKHVVHHRGRPAPARSGMLIMSNGYDDY